MVFLEAGCETGIWCGRCIEGVLPRKDWQGSKRSGIEQGRESCDLSYSWGLVHFVAGARARSIAGTGAGRMSRHSQSCPVLEPLGFEGWPCESPIYQLLAAEAVEWGRWGNFLGKADLVAL